jgi:hypothetical protein
MGAMRKVAGAVLAGAAITATVTMGAVTMGAGAASAEAPGCSAGQLPLLSLETAKSAVTICQWQGDGRLEYHGLAKVNGNSIVLPAYGSSGAYWAINNGYTYRVSADRLVIVAPDGGVVEAQPAI